MLLTPRELPTTNTRPTFSDEGGFDRRWPVAGECQRGGVIRTRSGPPEGWCR
jgi:hypothetical protein